MNYKIREMRKRERERETGYERRDWREGREARIECKSSMRWAGEGGEELSMAASIVASSSWEDAIVAKFLPARANGSSQVSSIKFPTKVFEKP